MQKSYRFDQRHFFLARALRLRFKKNVKKMKSLQLMNSFIKQSLAFAAMLMPGTLVAQLGGGVSAMSRAAARAIPAVVRVQTFLSDTQLASHSGTLSAMLVSSPQSGHKAMAGSASGVLLSKDGYIITNIHVLAEGDSIIVIMQDRREFQARLVGVDDQADLALLKIPGDSLPFLELDDPDLVRIGDQVLAVGNPLQLTSTVTAGILSARFRGIDNPEIPSAINSYLQTDAASNEGMSGSALVDINGGLIGINTAILSPTGVFAGYSFAVPSGLVRKAWHDLVAYEYIRHATLDVYFTDTNAADARKLNIKYPIGVVIDSLPHGGTGESAGLQKGDILIRIDGTTITNAAELREIIGARSPGDRVAIDLIRLHHNELVYVILSPLAAGLAATHSPAKTWQQLQPGHFLNKLSHANFALFKEHLYVHDHPGE